MTTDEHNPDDILSWAPAAIDRYEGDFQAWRQQGKRIAAFAGGQQWEEADRKRRDARKQPSLVFNDFAKYVHVLEGVQAQNRSWLHYKDLGSDDFALSQVFNLTCQATMNQEFEDEISDAFGDLVRYSVGCVFLSMDFHGRIPMAALERVHPHEMAWDITATRRNLRDRRWQNRRRGYTQWELQDAFGKKLAKECAPGRRGTGQDMKSAEAEAEEPYLVDHFQWKRIEYTTKYRVIDILGGNIFDFTAEEFERERAIFAANPRILVDEHEESRTRYFQAKFCGDVLLRDKTELPFGFTYAFMTGFRGHDGRFISPVENGMDPQIFKNYSLSTAIHEVSTAAKGWFIEEGATDARPQEFEEDFSSSSRIKWLARGAISGNQIKNIDSVGISPALVQFMGIADTAMASTLGISAEMIGMLGVEQSNVLEQTRQHASMTIFQPIFASERMLRKEVGRLLLGFMSRYYPNDTFIRINGPEVEPLLDRIHAVDVMRADVQIDEEPRTVSQRQATLLSLQQIQQQAGPATPPGVIKAIIKHMPLAPSDAKMIEDSMQPPPPSPAQQLEMQERAAKARKTMAEAQKIEVETHLLMRPQPSDPGTIMAEEAKMRALGLQHQAAVAADQRKAALSRQTHEQDSAELLLKNQLDQQKAARDLAKTAFVAELKEKANAAPAARSPRVRRNARSGPGAD